MSGFFFSTLRARLASVTLMALLPVLGLTLFMGWQQYRTHREAVEQHVSRMAWHVSLEQRELMERVREWLQALSQSAVLREPDPARCGAFLREEHGRQRYVVELGLADAGGQVLASTASRPGSVAGEPWFQRVLERKDFSVARYEVNPQTGLPSLTVGFPVFGEQGVVKAVLFATMDLQWVTRSAAMMDLPQGACVMVVDRSGRIVHFAGAEGAEGALVEDALQAALGEPVVMSTVSGTGWFYGVAPLLAGQKRSAVYAVVAIPWATAFGPARRMMIENALVWVLAPLWMWLALQMAGQRLLVQPIQRLIAATQRLARGELSTRVGPTGGGRELEQLGRSFDEMAEALAKQAAQLQRSEEQFRHIVETSPLGMHFWKLQPDGQLVLTGANPAADQMLGVEHAPLVGKRILDAFPWLAGTEVPNRYREVCVLGVPWHSEQIRYKDGQLVDVYEVYAFRTEPGSIAVMFRDVTERRKSLEALRESEQRFRQLVENSPDAIFVESLDGRVLDVNPAACRLHGLPREKLVGRHVTELVPPEFREQVRQDYQKLVSGEWTHFEGRSYTAAQTVVPVEVNVSRIQYAGQPALLLHVRDVSTRKRAELSLLESETRNRVLSEAAFEAIVLTDGGRIIDANSRMVELLGYSLAELVGKPMTEFIADESPSTTFEPGRRRSSAPVEILLRRKDASRVRVEPHSRIIPYKGRQVCVIAMRDITEEYRTREVMQRLAAAVEQAVEAIVITDPQGNILYVNRSFERITGYSRAEVLGRNPRILKSGKHDAAFYRELWDTLTRGEVWHGFFYNRKKDGTIYQEEASINPIKDDRGRITSYVAVKRDVTHERALQQQLLQAQKMEAIGRLAGGVAHDFNNRLTSVIGYCELALRRLPEADPGRRYLQEILKAADRAKTLTRQLLAFSRKQVLESVVFDLNDLLRNIQDMLTRTIGEDITLVMELQPKGLWPVKADPGQIEQVLLNLVVNARDAMPLGGQLTLRTANRVVDESGPGRLPGVTPGEYVQLSVADTGIGMTEEVRSHLFEPFFTTKEDGKGTGLGLATSYGIIQQSGGHIIVTTQPKAGTTFDIFLPRADGQKTVASHAVVVEEVPRTRTNETILLVEDEEPVRELARLVLSELGYNVLSAANGVEAIEVLHKHPDTRLDLLVTDVVMPQMGGRELAERLRQDRPGLKVLFTTGYSSEAESISRILSPSTFYLAKPFNASGLGRKVREVLDA